jgi:hypothetical protein
MSTEEPGTVIRREPIHWNGRDRVVKVVRCTCGGEVVCVDAWANTCGSDTCTTEWNGFGQRLAPRQFWGEETGESFT